MRIDSRELLAVGIFGGRSRLGDRVEMLLRRSRTFSPRMSKARTGFGMAILSGLLLAASLMPRWIAFAQQPARLSFEVASVRIDTTCSDGETEKFSPGRLTVTCIKLSSLIQAAYSRFADGKTGNGPHLTIAGSPEWMASARFDIAATASGESPMEEMFGPMLRSLLEERFRLRTHREARELPVYTLTALKGGPRVKPWKESDCIPVDLKHANDPSPDFCGMSARTSGLHVTDEARGMTMTEIAERMLGNRLDRPVVDRTGFAGRFDAHLEFDRDSSETSGLSLFTAVQEQLGLKLTPAKGPVEVLVIDHAEKPDAN